MANKIWFSIICDLNDNEIESEKNTRKFYSSIKRIVLYAHNEKSCWMLEKVEFQLKLWLKLMEKSKDLYHSFWCSAFG